MFLYIFSLFAVNWNFFQYSLNVLTIMPFDPGILIFAQNFIADQTLASNDQV